MTFYDFCMFCNFAVVLFSFQHVFLGFLGFMFSFFVSWLFLFFSAFSPGSGSFSEIFKFSKFFSGVRFQFFRFPCFFRGFPGVGCLKKKKMVLAFF